MEARNFRQQGENNGLLHPPSCACVRCAAGRESRELTPELRERVNEKLDEAFLQVVQGNFLMGAQALGQGGPIDVVRSGFLSSMGKLFQMREMAAEYFAEENPEAS